jgi:signal transduction histidine kinase
MSREELLRRLAAHRLTGDIPQREREWIAAHGMTRHVRVGELISSPRETLDELMILLSGHFVVFYRDRGGSGMRKVIEWTGGEDVTGLLPYSRLTVPPGEGRVAEEGDMVTVHKDHFPEMIRECHALTSKLVQVMLDRARHFQKDDLHKERLISLGKLAAGLAHELNNPTSAAVRSAHRLVETFRDADAAARALGASGITPEQLTRLERLQSRCVSALVNQVRSPLEQARHEEAIADWLNVHGVDSADVETIADAPISIETLDSLADSVDEETLEVAVRWLAADCAVLDLISEIEQAATKASELVQAVKGFTQMDRAPAPQPVNLEEGLTQSLTMLRAKARSKGIKVELTAEPGLPPVLAVSGELNQVWHNVIDNALDAVPDGGTISVSAQREGALAAVRIVDDGPGIPTDIQQRIFEPFFTTKPVGEGHGLGLDIVRRLVEGNNGSIDVFSSPGHTEFRIELPFVPETEVTR